jgi:hypothetical protein
MINKNLLSVLSQNPSPEGMRQSGFDYNDILNLISDLSYLCLNSMPSQIELQSRHQKAALIELWTSIHEKRNEKAYFGDLHNYATAMRTSLKKLWANISITFGSNDSYGFVFCEIGKDSKLISNDNLKIFVEFAAKNKESIENHLLDFGVSINKCENGILIIRTPFYKDFNSFTAVKDSNVIIHSAINSLPTENRCENID